MALPTVRCGYPRGSFNPTTTLKYIGGSDNCSRFGVWKYTLEKKVSTRKVSMLHRHMQRVPLTPGGSVILGFIMFGLIKQFNQLPPAKRSHEDSSIVGRVSTNSS
jgi:hypothetical protein